jgi:hypothetical protein
LQLKARQGWAASVNDVLAFATARADWRRSPRQSKLNLIAQAPLRSNAEAVTDQEHPDHEPPIPVGEGLGFGLLLFAIAVRSIFALDQRQGRRGNHCTRAMSES